MKKAVIIHTSAAVIFAGLIVSAYFLGKSSAAKLEDSVYEELDALRSRESDAAIVKRVSQQMENIAYQQKAVSDMERDRAEEQSTLAMAMRDRAEQESKLAKAAESKANEAAQEARQQRELAQNHLKMAEEQRDEANYARSVADTLNLRTIGRTLGTTAISQYESGNHDLASQMAFTSWKILNKYLGNIYQPDTYSALSICSNTKSSITTKKGGSVTALYSIPIVGGVIVTDYGEIEVHRKLGERRTVVLFNKKFNFRDVWADSTDVYALSYDGVICKKSYVAISQAEEIHLPAGRYFQMIELGNGLFMIAAKEHLLLMNLASKKIVKQLEFDVMPSTLAKVRDHVLIFFTDGSMARCDSQLNTTEMKPYFNAVATVAYCDEYLHALFIGYDSGDIHLINDEGKDIMTISSQVSAITDITTVGNLMISSSYDKTLNIWHLPFLRFDNRTTMAKALGIPESRLGDIIYPPSSEWLTPAGVSYQGWPLSICQFSEHEILVGTSTGEVQILNVSVSDMAKKVQNSGIPALSRKDWDRYVGKNVPYMSF